MTRFWEARFDTWNVQVLPGDIYVTAEDELISTVLGSCVAACVRDPARGIGGMNHFMLPKPPSTDLDGASARYGVYALECLVNQILRRGGRRSELEVKVFGGGRVLRGGSDIGRNNIEFVRAFMRDEGMRIAAEDVGGQCARRIRYWPRTGRLLLLQMPMDKTVVAVESKPLEREPQAGSVELF